MTSSKENTNWKSVVSGEVLDIRDGTHDSPKRSENGFPLITSKNLVSGKISFDDAYLISKKDHEAIKKRSGVEKGDILMPMIGTIGNPVLVETDQEFSIKNVALFRRNGSSYDERFLLHLLRSEYVTKQLHDNKRGGTQKFVSLGMLRNLKLLLPPITEQRRIATILDKADAIRRKRRQAIDLMNDFLRSVFLEMFGDPESNLKKWELFRLADVIDRFEGGKSFKSPEDDKIRGKCRILKISAISWGEFNPLESKPIPDTYVPPKYHFVRQGDLLISRANTSELVGAVSYVFDPPPPVILPDKLWRFVFRKESQVRPLYLLVLFQQQAIRDELARLGTGTSGSMKNISMSKMMGMQIPVPDLKTQNAFEELFPRYRQAITAINRQVNLTSELSSSLQNDLFGSD